MWSYNYSNTNELYHHGVKGMKWGQHIFSDENVRKAKGVADKLTTPSIKTGKDKAPISPGEKIGKETRNAMNDASNIANTISKSKRRRNINNTVSTMSNKELQDYITRMTLENKYSELNSDRVSSGKIYVQDVLGIIGSVAGIATAGLGIATAIKTLQG